MFAVLILAAMSVSAVVDYTVTSAVEVEDEADTTNTVDITITNTGNETLDTFSFAYTGETEDNDNDQLTFTFSTVTPASILAGATGTVTMTVVVDEDVDIGEYTGTVDVTANALVKQVSSTVTVTPEVCKSGVEGDLELSLDEPDSGETFKPGEEVNVDVTVENNDNSDMDVQVTAILYNLDENDEERKVSSEVMEIEEDDQEDFELTFTLPTDLDESDSYVLYVKAFEDDHESSNCNYESAEMQIERESHDVAVQKVELLPNTVECGTKVSAHVTVENIGTTDEDDVYVEFFAKDFSYREDSTEFDVEEFDDSDSDYVTQFAFDVPKTTKAGEYFVEAIAHYNDGDTHSLMEKLVVTCEGASSESSTTLSGNAILEVSNTDLKAVPGDKFSLELVVRNPGNEPLTVTLDVTEAQWADVLGVEAPSVLYPGDEFHAYAYLKLKEGTEPGKHNLRVNLRKESGLVASKLVTVTVPESTTVTITGAATAPTERGVTSWFTERPRLFWVVADLVLVALAVLFIRLLFKK